MLKLTHLALVGLIPCILAVVPVQAAAIVAYGDPADIGNQIWSGALAEDFNVISPITVSALGVFNSGQTGSITGTLTVAIFASNGTQETPTLTFHGAVGSLIGGDLFQNLGSAVTLLPGSYSITISGWGSDMNGNANCVAGGGCGPGPYTAPTLNTGGGALSFTGVGFSASPGLLYLGPTAPFPNNEFNAGSFEFTSSAPEPGSIIGVTMGLVLCLIPRFRRLAVKR